MATANTFRRKYLKWHKSYEGRAYKEFIKVFRGWGNNIDFSIMTENNYKEIVKRSVDVNSMFKAYETVYKEIGVLHGRRTGSMIIKQFKFFTVGEFESLYLKDLILWLQENGSRAITLLEKTYQADINRIIGKGFEEGKGIEEIARDLKKLVNKRSFYRWQAKRIARTEATSAANMGAMKAGDIAGVVMDKVWISSTDPRTRRVPQDKFDHLRMNETRIRATDPFQVSGALGVEKIMFPGDKKGSAGNIINCRCAVALVAARDKAGNLIFKS